jgi:hypothetical protein
MVDPVSGNTYNLNAAPTAITAIGQSIYEVYPGTSGGNIQSTSAALPRQWQVLVVHGDSSIYTYSVGYSLIV